MSDHVPEMDLDYMQGYSKSPNEQPRDVFNLAFTRTTLISHRKPNKSKQPQVPQLLLNSCLNSCWSIPPTFKPGIIPENTTKSWYKPLSNHCLTVSPLKWHRKQTLNISKQNSKKVLCWSFVSKSLHAVLVGHQWPRVEVLCAKSSNCWGQHCCGAHPPVNMFGARLGGPCLLKPEVGPSLAVRLGLNQCIFVSRLAFLFWS